MRRSARIARSTISLQIFVADDADLSPLQVRLTMLFR